MLGRKASVSTSGDSYKTARSHCRPQTAITTTTRRSFRRRPRSLHLQLEPNHAFDPRPQLRRKSVREWSTGSGRRKELGGAVPYTRRAVSGWRKVDEMKNMCRLSSAVESLPIPSSGSFDLGSGGWLNTALERSRTVTPSGMTFATTTSEWGGI